MSKSKKLEEVATMRAQILGPLLYESKDQALHAKNMKRISEEHGISKRTLQRWLFNYQHEGFRGLMPREKSSNKQSSVTEEIVDQAVMLRREVPTRSINQIIRILEMEGLVDEGVIKRSTLQDHLMKRGYGSRQLKMYHSTGVGAARRFQRPSRNDLWQMDIKYLLVLPETSKKAATQLYASVIIDDATRTVVACSIYEKQDVYNVLASFRLAIERYGIPECIYTDRGSQYMSKHLNQVCAKLGIKKLAARPMSPSSKGKVENFNKRLDSFVAELKLKCPKSVAEVQHYMDIWLQEIYHSNPHSALSGKSPIEAFKGDSSEIRWATTEQLNFSFMFTETRLVDKTGCISFRSKLWEAGDDLIGMRVDVSWKSDNPDIIHVYHDGFEERQISPLIIKSYSSPKKRTSIATKLEVTTSRELDAASVRYKANRDLSARMIAYRDMEE